jgi:hypothetical protein
MGQPSVLRVEVTDVVGRPIAGARVKVGVARPGEWQSPGEESGVPLTVPLQKGFTELDVEATAPHYFSERALLTLTASESMWHTSNPAWLLAVGTKAALLQVVLGRLRFAPVVQLPETSHIKVPHNPKAVLAWDYVYRRAFLNAESFRVLRRPAIGDPNASGWNRFAWEDKKVDLGTLGNWLVLEYGDDRDQAGPILIGVWAPHSFPGRRPPVVVQITPNPSPPGYPSDGLPFTGLYPYGCTHRSGLGSHPLSECQQSYAELPSNRSIVGYKAVYQLYAARSDIFSGGRGPIMITPVPAALRNGTVLRDPFTHRHGVGRLIGEVLRFLWSKKLTLESPAGASRLLFRPPAVEVTAPREGIAPTGFPRDPITTVLCHSAGAGPTLTLASHTRGTAFAERYFPASLFGGDSAYCESCWQNLWIIDGVGNPGKAFSPQPDSSTAVAWLKWVKAHADRRLVAVYTPSGLDTSVAPGLVTKVTRRNGTAGWIEEGSDAKVSWLRMSSSYLQASDPAKEGGLPRLAPVGGDSHNKVYELGVGYAARIPDS